MLAGGTLRKKFSEAGLIEEALNSEKSTGNTPPWHASGLRVPRPPGRDQSVDWSSPERPHIATIAPTGGRGSYLPLRGTIASKLEEGRTLQR